MQQTGLGLASLVARDLPTIVQRATSFRLTRRGGRQGKDVDLSFEWSGEGIATVVDVELKAHPRIAEVDELRAKVEAAAGRGAVYMLVAPQLENPVRSELC